jgi:hypothetical protein
VGHLAFAPRQEGWVITADRTVSAEFKQDLVEDLAAVVEAELALLVALTQARGRLTAAKLGSRKGHAGCEHDKSLTMYQMHHRL